MRGGTSTIGFLVLFLLGLCSLTVSSFASQRFQPVYACEGASVGTAFSMPLGIFFDTYRNECYVADSGNGRVVVCDDRGMPLYHFNHYVERDGKKSPGQPKRVVVDREGRIFLIDALVAYIDVLDFRGRRIDRIFPPTDSSTEDVRFGAIALAPDGVVVATLTCRPARAVFISSELEIVEIVTLKAPEADRQSITGVAVDAEGRIYVTDPFAVEAMVQVYDSTGAFVFGFGKHDIGSANFSLPTDISVTDSGELWVVDTIRQVASCFTRTGEYVTSVGGLGEGPGTFYFPSAVTTDGGGQVFVVERGGNRYQCFQAIEIED